jgi:hypothetical protein
MIFSAIQSKFRLSRIAGISSIKAGQDPGTTYYKNILTLL